jgi:signal transduction histidine kinase
MLSLQLPADVGAQTPPAPLPISEATALALERALLAANDADRLSELTAAVALDRNAASWAIRIAEAHAGRTVNRVEEAAAWLCGNLERELAAGLRTESSPSTSSTSNAIEWRLPQLAARLASSLRLVEEFNRRLEFEKLESLKELAYGASHEINNPLANIAARAQTLLDDEPDAERRRKLAAIHRQAMRAHEMIADLMLFARPPKLRLATCELGPLVRRVVDELHDLASEYGVDLAYESETDKIQLMADDIQLAVAIGAIVTNALEAAGDGGHVNVIVRHLKLEGAPSAEVSICDDGPGISANVRRHMFDPFFSGREAGRGLGFGASKCWRIVTDHGGQMLVHSRGGGTEVTIQIPLAPVREAPADRYRC